LGVTPFTINAVPTTGAANGQLYAHANATPIHWIKDCVNNTADMDYSENRKTTRPCRLAKPDVLVVQDVA